MTVDLTVVPEPQRDLVAAVLRDELGGEVERIESGPAGASGAFVYRVDASDGWWLLRVEGDRMPIRNPHQYRNLRAASEAGVAPPVRLADDDSGVLVMRWIDARPLTDHPGGPEGLLRVVGELIAEVQRLDPFPAAQDWADGVSEVLDHLVDIGRYAPGVLDPHIAEWSRIRSSWTRDPGAFVPAHNDPNANNLLFDGDRVWLVDWETSGPNDLMVDLAIVANQLAPTPDLADALIRAWGGGPPDARRRARLAVARASVKLWAAGMLAAISAGDEAPTDFAAPTMDLFMAQMAEGAVSMATSEGLATFSAIVFDDFLATTSTREFDEALRIASEG
jgi:aminoglycoside phosphotransferase (APT) family kinase protein